MLHIILLILKILGIILLIILGLFLLILCCVLFVAVSYRIRLEKQDSLRVTASAGWLFRIVTIRYLLDGADGFKQDLQVRLFGIPILKPFEEKKAKKKRPKRRKTKEQKEKQKEDRRQKDEPAVSRAEQAEASDGSDILKEAAIQQEEYQDTQNVSAGKQPGEREQKPKPSVVGKILSIFRKLLYAIRGICDKIKNIWKKLLGIRDTVHNLLERKDAFLEFWRLEEHVRARSAVWKEVRYLWKKWHPKKIKGKVTFGFDDPSVTGLCMGGVGMLCAWYPKELQIVPDFERKVLEGDIRIRGKMRAYVLVFILWRIYFNKDIRHMYKHWKQL